MEFEHTPSRTVWKMAATALHNMHVLCRSCALIRVYVNVAYMSFGTEVHAATSEILAQNLCRTDCRVRKSELLVR